MNGSEQRSLLSLRKRKLHAWNGCLSLYSRFYPFVVTGISSSCSMKHIAVKQTCAHKFSPLTANSELRPSQFEKCTLDEKTRILLETLNINSKEGRSWCQLSFSSVITASFDTEVVYVICAMNSSVFLGHAIYCMQSSCSLRVLPSLLGTLCLAALQAWCLQSLLLVASFDYSPCVIVSFLICCYVHWNVAYFMNHLTRKEVILACSKVFTSCPKLC